jgi:hypothetical protein
MDWPRTLTLSAVFALALMSGQGVAGETGQRLTADDVRSTFVDREWSQGEGTFLFSSDGTYRYADHRMRASGTYRIGDDGVLCTSNARSGVRTCYTYYRTADGYRYWHDRSGRYWPVYLR